MQNITFMCFVAMIYWEDIIVYDTVLGELPAIRQCRCYKASEGVTAMTH